mgnify:CR=1 FL=1
MKGVIPMNEEDTITKALREVGPRYITNSQQELVGFMLTPEEYEDYLNMRLRSETTRGARSAVPGKQLLRFAGAIPLDDLRLMQQAIEIGCEAIDSNEW